MNFIKSRLNRDNFWNLMFWVGMTVGWSITAQFGKQDPNGAFIISSWLTILGVPYIVTRSSKVTFDKDKGFFNSEGKCLKGSYPTAFGIVIALTIGLIALIGLVLDKAHINIPTPIGVVLLMSFFFLIPTLYFIYRNCPISILFNRHTWCSKIPGLENNTTYPAHLNTSSNWSTSLDPYYRHWGGNIHRRK